MLTNVNYGTVQFCETSIGLLLSNDNSIVLGDVFFVQYLGIFDVENDRIGIAKSSRALPGSLMTCIASDKCQEPVDPSA